MFIEREKLLKNVIEIKNNESTDGNSINIVFGVDSNYVKYAAITIQSIIYYNPYKNIGFHIFCDCMNDDDFNKLKQIIDNNTQISLKVYFLSNDMILDFPQSDGWNLSIYYRAIAPYILYGKVRKMLYLDADIICLGKIKDLFTMNLQCVAGVVEDGLGKKSQNKQLARLGISSHKKYFNSGVMLIDVNKYVEEDILVKFIDVIRSQHNKLAMFDQDAFNMILGDQVCYLSNIYNVQVPNKIKNIVFLHFIGSLKPWFTNAERFGSIEWKQFYFNSPWGKIPLLEKKQLSSHECRKISKYFWSVGKYKKSIIAYLKYLNKKIRGL